MSQTPLTFSTIKTKSKDPNDAQKLNALKTTSNTFHELMKEPGSPSRDKNEAQEARSQRLRTLYTIPDPSSINLKIVKKGKKSGKTYIRPVTLADTGNQNFRLSQPINKKVYIFPSNFIAETKDNYSERLSTSPTKKDKSKILPWATGEFAEHPYRIVFIRKPLPQQQEQQFPDSAFYFNSKEEVLLPNMNNDLIFEKWNRVRNFLQAMRILENNESSIKPNALLERLNQSFKVLMLLKFRGLLAKRSQEIQRIQYERKVNECKISGLLRDIDKRLLEILVQKWIQTNRTTRTRKIEKRAAQMTEREVQITTAVESSSMLAKIDENLSRILLSQWKQKAVELIKPKQEDINIVFNRLELISAITQPIIKLEISIDNFALGMVNMNGKPFSREKFEYTIQARHHYKKNNTVNCWRLYSDKTIPENQRLFAQKDDSLESVASLDDRFCIQFDDFKLDYLDKVKMKITISDQSSNSVLAYQYTTLRELYWAGQNGHNIWFCMQLNIPDRRKFPLLNLRVKTQTVSQKNSTGAATSSKFTLSDYIRDTNYKYGFNIPKITPEHIKVLEQCPLSLGVMNERGRYLLEKEYYNEFIQRLIHKLCKVYYQETTRQFARLNKSAYIWAEIQDEIISQASKKTSADSDSLYLTGENFKSVLDFTLTKNFDATQSKLGIDIPAAYNNVISYLFKRDQWEITPEWRSFYLKLGILFRKGLPPQQRTQLWSEIGKVVYFIAITEACYTVYKGITKTKNEGPEDLETKSKRVYNMLKLESQREFFASYQELEDDIEYLRKLQKQDKLPFETHIRNICSTFIVWSAAFNSSRTKSQYVTSYSRSILTLCQGLLTSQNCNSSEELHIVDEDQVFWLLISLVAYILPNYYGIRQNSLQVDELATSLKADPEKGQGSPFKKPRRKVSDTFLLSDTMTGIRSDLLLLRILLKTHEEELYSKFDELGVPFEYYFADYMLTLFFGLFNPGLTFRIWDIIFFEGTSLNKAKCSQIIVCVLYTLLKQCKEQIMLVKKSSDIKLILDLNAKFETKYGDFIKQIYDAYKTFFAEETLPAQQKEPLDFIFNFKCTALTELVTGGDVEKRLSSAEQSLSKRYFLIQGQNKTISELVNPPSSQPDDNETMTYSLASKMVKDLQAKFHPEVHEPGNRSPHKKLRKEDVGTVHVRIHSIKADALNTNRFILHVIGASEKKTKQDTQLSNINFEVQFPLQNFDSISRYITVELFDSNTLSRKLLSSTVDLRGFLSNVVTKVVMKMDEEKNEIYNPEHIGAEIEFSILLETKEAASNFVREAKGGHYFTIPELEDPEFKAFRKIDFEESFLNQVQNALATNADECEKYMIFSKNRYYWKERFAITLEEFIKILIEIAPVWIHRGNLSSIYNSMAQVCLDKKFYVIDFFTIIISNGKFSLRQKLELLFDLLAGFDRMCQHDSHEIPAFVLKGLLSDIYEAFMIYIPQNEIENMIDFAVKGQTCQVKDVSIKGTSSRLQLESSRSLLNKLSNFIHLNYNTRDLLLCNKDVLEAVKDNYKTRSSAYPQHAVDAQNKVEIAYQTNNMNHKTAIPVNEDWEYNGEAKPDPNSPNALISELLALSKDSVLLNHTPYTLNKQEFVDVMQKMPLINYLYAFENIQSQPVMKGTNTVSFKVQMNDDVVLNITTKDPQEKQTNQPAGSVKKDIASYVRNWDSVVRFLRQRVSKTKSISSPANPTNVKQTSITVPAEKLKLSFSFAKLLRAIRKRIIRRITDAFDATRYEEIAQFDSRLLNENLWDLEFDVYISTNKVKKYKITDTSASPYLTFLDLALQSPNPLQGASNIEVIFALKYSTVKETYTESFNQLAKYNYADGTNEWLPCRIAYKFQYIQSKKDESRDANKYISGYGVIFQQFPNEVILKEAPNVVIMEEVDLNELELRKINTQTSQVIKVNQNADNLDQKISLTSNNTTNIVPPSRVLQPEQEEEIKLDWNQMGADTNTQKSKVKVNAGLPPEKRENSNVLGGEQEEEEADLVISGKLQIKHR